MCWPRVVTFAVTCLVPPVPEHVRVAHTTKVRRLPRTGGPAGCGAVAVAGRRTEACSGDTPPAAAWRRASPRREASNATALGRGGEGPAKPRAAGRVDADKAPPMNWNPGATLGGAGG